MKYAVLSCLLCGSSKLLDDTLTFAQVASTTNGITQPLMSPENGQVVKPYPDKNIVRSLVG